ncbi:phenylacetaldehyde oxime monooxygenase CYP71AN24 [Arachis hypogaea]|uniref:phenylacetaldehyde oxime monooxygenase CYP71AN24 n=1 Tax=Arachis hypogaea TaxID=3818 RepID=UPI000DEC0EFB|nr:cytochrome P450 71A1 [Arachis hypogaea]QHO57402.1 Cytochrome P450 [Arachis hypogaea]
MIIIEMMNGRTIITIMDPNLLSYVRRKLLPYNIDDAMFFIISTFIIIILLLLFFHKLKIRRTKLKLPPCPPKLPFIGNYHQLGTLPHRTFQSLSKTYGPLILLYLGHLRVLVVSSVELAKEVMQTNDVVFANRPHHTATRVLLYGCKDIAFESYGEAWRQKRKICVLELLSAKKVQLLQYIKEEEVTILINKLRESCMNINNSSYSNSTNYVNLSEIIITTTNNIVSRCIFGRKYHDLEGNNNKDNKNKNKNKNNFRFGEIVRKVMSHLLDLGVGDLFPMLGWVDVLISGRVKRYRDTFEVLDAFFDHVIEEHKMASKEDDHNNKMKDFVDTLLQHQKAIMVDFELGDDDVKALILDMFLGGSDTTSSTLEWAFTELMRSPIKMKKAQEEVRRVIGNKSKLEENDINQMNYLKCVIKETLRLHPAAPLLTPRETTCKTKLQGYDIPQKTMVYVNVWAIQRDPQIWQEPDEFIPERFEDNEVNFNGKCFEFLPFGSGRRKCPGMTFGLTSVEYVLANLLCWFDWKLPNQSGVPGHALDMSETFGLTVNRKVPLYLQPIMPRCDI